jgi:hypothetical protein
MAINSPDPITSPHGGGSLDLLRTAIMALQHYAEAETDDQELAHVHKLIVGIQTLLASHAKNPGRGDGRDAGDPPRPPCRGRQLLTGEEEGNDRAERHPAALGRLARPDPGGRPRARACRRGVARRAEAAGSGTRLRGGLLPGAARAGARACAN